MSTSTACKRFRSLPPEDVAGAQWPLGRLFGLWGGAAAHAEWDPLRRDLRARLAAGDDCPFLSHGFHLFDVRDRELGGEKGGALWACHLE